MGTGLTRSLHDRFAARLCVIPLEPWGDGGKWEKRLTDGEKIRLLHQSCDGAWGGQRKMVIGMGILAAQARVIR